MKREANIDLLRSLCMAMVVALHFFAHSGIWETIPVFSTNFYIARFVIALCRCAVNCFVLIAGYLNVSKTFSSKRIFSIIIQAWTYSVVLLTIATVGGLATPSATMTIRGLFPISTKMYWFISTYFGLMLLSPVLNVLLNELSYGALKRCVAIGFFLFSVLGYIYPNADLFYLNDGYSLIWFVFMYVTGAMFKRKVQEGIPNTGYPLAMYLAVVLIAWGGELLFTAKLVPISDVYKQVLTDYASPATFLCAVSLFMCFQKLNLKNALFSRVAAMLGVNTLGVYLLHEWPYLRNFVWKELFNPAAYGESPRMFVYLLFCVAVIFTAGILLECIRGKIAKFVLNRPVFAKIFEKLDAIFEIKVCG